MSDHDPLDPRSPHPPPRTPRRDVPVPLPVHRAADAPPPAGDVEVTLSVHADGRQIVVRRCTASDGEARRTVHIDAVVR